MVVLSESGGLVSFLSENGPMSCRCVGNLEKDFGMRFSNIDDCDNAINYITEITIADYSGRTQTCHMCSYTYCRAMLKFLECFNDLDSYVAR